MSLVNPAQDEAYLPKIKQLCSGQVSTRRVTQRVRNTVTEPSTQIRSATADVESVLAALSDKASAARNNLSAMYL